MDIVVTVALSLVAFGVFLSRANRTMPGVIAAELQRTGRPVVVRAYAWEMVWDPAKAGIPSSLDGPGLATYSLGAEAETVNLLGAL